MKQNIVTVCATNAGSLYRLLDRGRTFADRLGCALNVIFIARENDPGILEYVFQCAKRYQAELMALYGEKANRSMLLALHKNQTRCVVTDGDPAFSQQIRLALAGVPVMMCAENTSEAGWEEAAHIAAQIYG